MTFRVLVTGGRDFHAQRAVDVVLDQVFADCRGGMVLLHGAAAGADACANAWAMAKRAAGASVGIHRWHAEWRRFGAAAGRLRNQRMFEEGRPDLVVAFPGGADTADCVRRAQEAGIGVLVIQAPKEAQPA